MLLVDQNASGALGASGRAYVPEAERIVLEGRGLGLLADLVREAYLGLVGAAERP